MRLTSPNPYSNAATKPAALQFGQDSIKVISKGEYDDVMGQYGDDVKRYFSDREVNLKRNINNRNLYELDKDENGLYLRQYSDEKSVRAGKHQTRNTPQIQFTPNKILIQNTEWRPEGHYRSIFEPNQITHGHSPTGQPIHTINSTEDVFTPGRDIQAKTVLPDFTAAFYNGLRHMKNVLTTHGPKPPGEIPFLKSFMPYFDRS